MEKQARIKYWDLLKGIAIFLVVWGHTIQYGGSGSIFFDNKAFIFIYSFHMPLFLLISGYFLAKSAGRRSFVQNLEKAGAYRNWQCLAEWVSMWSSL